MNYRHAFHAGNFADLVKHAVLLSALGRLQARAAALRVVDTHGGAGRYPIDRGAPREAEAVLRLLGDSDAPPVFAPLKQLVDPGASGRLIYPGSPLLIARRLRPDDRLTACELQPEQHAALRATLAPFVHARALEADGYEAGPRALGGGEGALLLIDPPYERGDDYDRLIEAVLSTLQTAPGACVLVWAPLKDLETLDRLVRSLEALGAGGFTAEVRLRPPLDPMRLNGCATIVLNPPEGLEADASAACAWTAAALGEPGGSGRVWPLTPQA